MLECRKYDKCQVNLSHKTCCLAGGFLEESAASAWNLMVHKNISRDYFFSFILENSLERGWWPQQHKCTYYATDQTFVGTALLTVARKHFPIFCSKQNKLVVGGKFAIIRDLTSSSRHCHLIAEKVLEELPLSNKFHGSVKIHEYWTWSLWKVKFHRLATIICWNHQNYPKSLRMNDGYIYFPGKCTLKPGNMRGTNIRAVSQ